MSLTYKQKKLLPLLNSGGVVNIKGSTFSFEATAKSGGVIKANNFLSSQTKVSASSGGSCKANARDIFEAKASLGGAIDVYGNPKTFNQTISLGGNITEIKND